MAYPEGTCAEAGAIAAMVAAGETRLSEVFVIADAPLPVSPCGGCRQKLAEFGTGDVVVTMATTEGSARQMTLAELFARRIFADPSGSNGSLMDARAIIARLRAGQILSNEELSWFARGLSDGGVSDAQAGAFAMAACLNGLGEAGRVALTLAMRDSGKVLSWDLGGPVVDKTFDRRRRRLRVVGYRARAGRLRGLCADDFGAGTGPHGRYAGQTRSDPRSADRRRRSRFFGGSSTWAGCAIVSASADIAPADKRLYAIRDVTATVESLDLITASILSKKLAGGLEALVLDVKCGSGAFMKTRQDARALAQALVTTATLAGCPTSALITDMNQPVVSGAGQCARGGRGDAGLVRWQGWGVGRS